MGNQAEQPVEEQLPSAEEQGEDVIEGQAKCSELPEDNDGSS